MATKKLNKKMKAKVVKEVARLEKEVDKLIAKSRAMMKALSDDTRFSIVEILLFDGETGVTSLLEQTRTESTLLSHHLRILRDVGIVVAQRIGKNVSYKINPKVKVRGKKRGITMGGTTVTLN